MHSYKRTARKIMRQYDVVLTKSRYDELCTQIANQCYKKLPSKDSSKEVYSVIVSGKRIPVIFNPETKKIETTIWM